MKNTRWTERDYDQARKLRSAGLTYAEIARALGRTEAGVRDKCLKELRLNYVQTGGCYDGPPLATCDESLALKRNAIHGSQKLLAEIRRVFGC